MWTELNYTNWHSVHFKKTNLSTLVRTQSSDLQSNKYTYYSSFKATLENVRGTSVCLGFLEMLEQNWGKTPPQQTFNLRIFGRILTGGGWYASRS